MGLVDIDRYTLFSLAFFGCFDALFLGPVISSFLGLVSIGCYSPL